MAGPGRQAGGRFRLTEGGRDGFTFVEILIVVMVLAILAAILIPGFAGASDEARASALQSDLRILQRQI